MLRKVFAGFLAFAIAGCAAEAFSGGSHGAPCRPWDRRCVAKKKAPPAYALEVLWGGTAGSVGASSITTKSGQPVTVTRSSPTLCADNSGGFSNYMGANQSCVEPNGLASRPATTTLIYGTSNMGASWGADAPGTTANIVGGQACPDGTNSGIIAYDTTSNSYHRVYVGSQGASAGTYTFSVYAKPFDAGTGTTICSVLLQAGGDGPEQAAYDICNGTPAISSGVPIGMSTTNSDYNMTPAGNGFYRLTFAYTDSFSGGFQIVRFGPDETSASGSYAGIDSGVILCDPMMTFLQDDRPYVVNDGGNGTTATRAADLISVANPLDGGPFVIAATISIDNFKADNWIQRGVISGGWDAGQDSNTWTLYISDGGYPTFATVDGAGGHKTWTATHIAWPGTRFIQVFDNAGTVTMYQGDGLDGGLAPVPLASAGAGTGIINPQPSTIFLGSQGAYGNPLGGTLQDICGNNDTGTGCAYKYSKQYAQRPAARTMAALGDSLTLNTQLGQYPPVFPSWFWPNMFAKDTGWTVANDGVPGYTVMNIDQKYVDAGLWQSPPRFTTIETGINDIVASQSGTTMQFWYEWFLDHASSSGSSPIVWRESPCSPNTCTTGSPNYQSFYDAFQGFVWATAVTKHGYPTIDNFDGGQIFGTIWNLADAGSHPPHLPCQFDIGESVTGAPNDNVCANLSETNGTHLNDAGQGQKEAEIRALLGI